MSRTVTAGLDSTRESLAAAHWAAREAVRRGLPLRLVHVQEWRPYVGGMVTGYEIPAQLSDRMPEDTVRQVRDAHPDVEIITEEVPGQPAAVLSTAADESELLVLGSRALSGAVGFLVGSVAMATVSHAARPVILVRAGQCAEDEHLPDLYGAPSTTTAHRDVVLGLDLNRPCDELIDFAFDTADRRGARLRVVSGWKLPPMAAYQPEAMTLAQKDIAPLHARALTDALLPWCGKFPGVEVVEHALIGRPAHHLVDAKALALMKDDAILVNTGRGGLVDTDALLAALRAGRLAGAGLDVYEEEAGVFFLDKSLEVMTDERLARLVTFPNVIVTSHQAYFTRDAVGQITEATARNVRDYLAGRTGENTLVPAPAG
ncbi:NAD(P)-dependent oxidoreductase [Streptomyces sp. B1866]|uniref:universal stress protein n=1 Tax=Streptomyces sp. B1866 TaxID=3075431 RepID=UPI00288DC05D|nr:universal stress protein [Streptomyces sp. B1866]MDT3399381.1 NAD(P)-dependent oxidoreductase [Streptomyces sp. B1866]